MGKEYWNLRISSLKREPLLAMLEGEPGAWAQNIRQQLADEEASWYDLRINPKEREPLLALFKDVPGAWARHIWRQLTDEGAFRHAMSHDADRRRPVDPQIMAKIESLTQELGLPEFPTLEKS